MQGHGLNPRAWIGLLRRPVITAEDAVRDPPSDASWSSELIAFHARADHHHLNLYKKIYLLPDFRA
jgi:hypothetical protein